MKTWFITGASSGFGRALARRALERGDQVVVTARNKADVDELVVGYPGMAVAATLDVTREGDATSALQIAHDSFGGIDVLVNAAGYGFIGAVEEATPSEYRPMFEANVFGLIEATRSALPMLRERTGSTIVNFSSGAGIAGSAGSGYYNATKFAVEGLSEALAEELKPLGTRVIIVEPGPFRTSFLGRSIATAACEIQAYHETAGKRRVYRNESDGKQAGDPEKGVSVILRAVDSAAPPLHLPLGPIAFATADAKLASFRRDVDTWRDVAVATDYDEPEVRR